MQIKKTKNNGKEIFKTALEVFSFRVNLHSTTDFYNSLSEQNLWQFPQPDTEKTQLSESIMRSAESASYVLRSVKEPLFTLKTAK